MDQPLPTAQINTPPGVIDLGRGDPQFALLPREMLRQAAELRLSQSDNAYLQYGAEAGDGNFRHALAGFLSAAYGFPVDPHTLFVTSGISSALDLFCTLFTSRGDVVFVEEPSYFLALRIFADHGLQVVPIATDAAGLIVDAVEEALQHHRPRFLYVIPAFQNPSGRTLDEGRRRDLLAVAEQHNLLLIADEVYQLLNYTVEPPRCFGAYTDHENVVSLGSFSKILAPGLRLGWVQAHPTIVKRLVSSGLLDSGGGMNPFTSAVVRGVIDTGALDQNITGLRQTYGTRVRALDEALRRNLPQAEYAPPDGGYFFWLRLTGIDTAEVRRKASAQRVDFRQGSLFSSEGGLREYLRLGISFYDVKDLDEGVLRLARCLRE